MAHKENNVYYKARKETKLSQDKASYELFDGLISPDRLFRIESGTTLPTPEEVCLMADRYKKPELKNYHCNHECEIGRTNGIDGVGDIDKANLPIIVLDLLSSLNSIPKDELIKISADGKIDENEKEEFIKIRDQLNKIMKTVESLKIWADKNIEE